MSTDAVSEDLLSIIVCPDCHGELVLSEVPDAKQTGSAATDVTLTCQSCGLVYPVKDGIPVLLVDEARKPS
jgi:uncharacterized protein